MSDRIHRALTYLIAMAMVTAVAAAPTVAQKADPSAEGVFEVAGINADRVDGYHAIGATANKALRAKKLVATNKYGQLPSNIIRPRWKELKGVPAGFKDGVDDVGIWKVTITTQSDTDTVAADVWASPRAVCPTGTKVVGGGFRQWDDAFQVTDSYALGNGWQAYGKHYEVTDQTLTAYAYCLATSPASGLASRGDFAPAGKKQ